MGGTGRCAAHLILIVGWLFVWGRFLVVLKLVEECGKVDKKNYREEKWIWNVSKWDLGQLSR